MAAFDPFIEAWELRGMVRNGDLRPREVAEFFLARIARHNPTLGAYMTVSAERALGDVQRIEADHARAASMPMYGIAYSLKDLTPTKDIITTSGSRNYATAQPVDDAVIAVKLRVAGGILLGKTSTPEFGGRPTTEGGLCPTAHNPWNLDHNAGGSSGGAAAQVAAGLGPLAEGSDGGGSIRGPSSNSGVVGLSHRAGGSPIRRFAARRGVDLRLAGLSHGRCAMSHSCWMSCRGPLSVILTGRRRLSGR